MRFILRTVAAAAISLIVKEALSRDSQSGATETSPTRKVK